MNTTWEQLEAAALALARSGSIKDRLTDAFRNHLAQINSEELPDALRAQFRACHEALTRERPQPGEDAVRATVRKLSAPEADALACSVVRLYGDFVREATHSVAATEAAAVSTLLTGTRAKKAVPQVISLYAHEG